MSDQQQQEENPQKISDSHLNVERQSQSIMPWLDTFVTEEVKQHLWDCIDNEEQKDARGTLAGQVSKSNFFQDKNNWFYENVLKGLSEQLYYRDWNNYQQVVVANKPGPEFYLKTLWVNYQKQYEFNPAHYHSNGNGFSFVVFMKIPTHWKDQHALPFSANSNCPQASDFQFLLGSKGGLIFPTNFPLCPEDEGRILFFPAWMAHQVYPFYGTEEERITISGNIIQKEKDIDLNEKERVLEEMKKKVISFENLIEKEKKDILNTIQKKVVGLERIDDLENLETAQVLKNLIHDNVEDEESQPEGKET